MSFHVPAKQNARLKQLLERITSDVELHQLWKCANINAVDRSGISDHGEVHIRIVANAALKLIRVLVEGGIKPSIVENYGMTNDDAEVVVVMAACLHDTGISIHRDDHEKYSLFIANRKAREMLTGIYEEPQLTIMMSEILHCIIAHDADQKCLTIEAGALKVADTTDMTRGRSRIPFQAGQVNIHSVSAQAVKDVKIEKGERSPRPHRRHARQFSRHLPARQPSQAQAQELHARAPRGGRREDGKRHDREAVVRGLEVVAGRSTPRRR